MRDYIKLLRLPYQFQLGPIFCWGFLLAGGDLVPWHHAWRFLAVFLLFHVGAFGGLTALNSFYDRDEGPVGGMWQPPPVPWRLWHFAWVVQIGGLALLLPFGLKVALIYAFILLLSLGYSHPRTRWKGHPFKSLAVVGLGQGVFDFAAGAFTANAADVGQWQSPLWCGLTGATLTVLAFYPLTQMYQLSADTKRGDRTIAAWLYARGERQEQGGRAVIFHFAMLLFTAGSFANALALWYARQAIPATALVVFSALPLWYLTQWRLDRTVSQASDFARIHFLMRAMALGFGGFIGFTLLRGGL
ncbi:MAG TPA: UbiA family prenyltransferase [Abditibacteriaceae bacterium]